MSANEIKKLNDYQHSRLRTEMYLGGRAPHTQDIILYDNDGKPTLKEVTWVPALYTAFREILDNSLDEVIGHKHGTSIKVTFDPKKFVFSVEDNGRGIPIKFDEEHGMHLATMVLTSARAGRNFGERGETVGQNGIGAAAVAFTSEWMQLEIHNDGKRFNQEFKEGNIFGDDLQILDPIIVDLKHHTGTKVSFTPSREVFEHLVLPEEFLWSRLWEIAVINPTVKIYYNGELLKVKKEPELSLFPNKDIIKIDVIDKAEKFNSTFLVLPEFTTEGENYHTVINNIPAFNGGVHIELFKKMFYAGLLTALEKESKKRKLTPNRSDINEGLLIYNITKMIAPTFDSQSKTRLTNENVSQILKKFLENSEIYINIIKKYRTWIEAIYVRCEERTHKKDMNDIAKLTKKVSRSKVEKLVDATGDDRSKCCLFLAEGDCMDSETNIKILIDGELSTKKAKDINVGDVVITHKSRYKFVTNTTSKVSKGKEIKTKFGNEIFSDAHRLFIYDKEEHLFYFIEVKNIDKSKHQLVRSKLADMGNIAEIFSNDEIVDEKYHRKITFGYRDEPNVQFATNSHKYAVFNLITHGFEMIQAKDLDSNKHAMIIK